MSGYSSNTLDVLQTDSSIFSLSINVNKHLVTVLLTQCCSFALVTLILCLITVFLVLCLHSHIFPSSYGCYFLHRPLSLHIYLVPPSDF